MFSFIKKRNKKHSSKNEEIIRLAATLLDTQFTLYRSQLQRKETVDNEFFRGYIIGYFDGALQQFGEGINSDEAFFLLLIQGHALLLSQYMDDTQSYTLASLRMKDAPLFIEGQQAGGNDFYGLNTSNSKLALNLAEYFKKW